MMKQIKESSGQIVLMTVLWIIIFTLLWLTGMRYNFPLEIAILIFSILWLIFLAEIIINRKALDKKVALVDSFFSGLGFKKFLLRDNWVPDTIPEIEEGWKGTYRKRGFDVRILRIISSSESSDVAVCIRTPNRSGKKIDFYLDEKQKMENNKLGDIYEKLDRMGAYRLKLFLDGRMNLGWRVRKGPFAKLFRQDIWLFEINEKEVNFRLQSFLINEKNLKESLDIICDTMDRLGM